MPRKPRQHSMLNTYHIVIKGINSQLLFEEHSDYLKYLEILELKKSTCGFDLYAYCLMSNHVHLLMHVNEVSLDSIFRKINTAYANWFNMKYSRSGPLQDGRYYSEPVESLDYLLAALRYIHKNPLNAKLEATIGSQYPWNSFHSYIKQNNRIVDTSFILSEFKSIDDFIAFHSPNFSEPTSNFLDVNTIKRRIPDDVAIDIIKQNCNVTYPTDISKFDLLARQNAVLLLREKGISARQINRLTGIPRGIVDRILSNKM